MTLAARRGSLRPARPAPLAARWAAKRVLDLGDPLLRHRRRLVDRTPVPPRSLRARTGAPGIREFVDGGREAALELASALAVAGRSLDTTRSVLDFGCGPARVLPQIAMLAPDASCTGCDVDRAAISWAIRHYPGHRWSLSRFQPPLPFRDSTFDLVYSISVLSHLDERHQDEWLAELHRILAPGGVALVSIHGQHAFAEFASGRVTTAWCPKSAFERTALAPNELIFVPYTRSVWNTSELPGIDGDYGIAFHGSEYVRGHWSQALEVIDVLPRAMTSWQDIVVLRK
jgi:SAM-dependent methyltransferase